jgi:hypothetical protein
MRSLKTRELLFAGSGRNVVTFTDTTYADQAQVAIVPFPFADDFDSYTVVGTCLLQNDTAGEDVSARLYDYASGTLVGDGDAGEVTHTGSAYTPVKTGEVTVDDTEYGPDPAWFGFQAKVTAGTGLIDRTTIAVYGQR